MVTDPTPAGLRYSGAAGRWVLAATILGSAIASIDATVVGIALPAIGRDFDTGMATLQWVVTAYSLTLSGLLLVAGALGDRYGRRRVFLVGVVWFALASLLCGIAPNAGTLVAARALQGVGAALLTPGSLAILQASFRPDDRGKAIGAWSGISGVASAIGPFLGGWLIQAASWRLIFVINLPVAAAVVAISVRRVPESADPGSTGGIDAPGGILATTGLIGVVYGLIEGPSAGFAAPQVVVALAAGLALLVAFVLREWRTAHPMLPLGLFRSRQFSATNAVTFVIYGALGGALFLLPIQLQQVAGYTAVEAGLSLLPVTLIMLVLSTRSGALAGRIGPRLQMSVGPVLVGAGMALLSRVGSDGTYLTRVLPALVVLGLGLATTVAPLTTTVLAALPERHSGIASAVNNDVARAAGLVAVAVLPAAAGITGTAYLHPDAFATGFQRAVLICAALCVLGGGLAAATIRNPVRRARPERANAHCALDAPPRAATRTAR